MKKVRITKRQLGAYVRSLLLNESKMASGLVKPSSGTAGFEGAARVAGGIVIKDIDLKLALLSMISRGDIGLMGNVFEDVAMVSSLPALHRGSGYQNLNDTLAMLNSPAADLGLGFGDSVTTTPSPTGGTIYKVSGDSWSVKSSAAASKSGFSTKATALGQLAACGLHSANQITINNLDSQSECYQQMTSFLSPNDEVHFNMGLCYYKYDRDDSQIQRLTGAQMGEVGLGDARAMFSLSATSLSTSVINSVAVLNKLVPEDYYVTNPTGIYNMPAAEGKKMSPATFSQVKRLTSKKSRENKKGASDAQLAAIQAQIDALKSAAGATVGDGKVGRDPVSRNIQRDPNGDSAFFTYVVPNPASTNTFMKGFKVALAGVLIARMTTILGDFIFNPSGNKSQRQALLTRLFQEIPGLQSDESATIDIDVIKDIIVAIEGSYNDFFQNAISNIPSDAGRSGKNADFVNIVQGQFIQSNIASCVENFLTEAISAQRNIDPEYISIHRIRPTAVDIDNLAKPAFKMIYAKSEDNLFKLKLLSKSPAGSANARFKLKIPSGGETEIQLAGSDVRVPTGIKEPISGTTGWSTTPAVQSTECIKLVERPGDETGIPINSIITTSVAEYDAMMARQSEMFSALANSATPTVTSPNSSATIGTNIGSSGFQIGSSSTPTKQELEADIVKSTIFYIKDGQILTAEQANRVLGAISSAMEDVANRASRIQFPGMNRNHEDYTIYLLQQTALYVPLVNRLNDKGLVGNISRPNSALIKQMHSHSVMYVHDALQSAYNAINSSTTPMTKEQRLIYNGEIRQFIQASGILEDGFALDTLKIKGKNPPWDNEGKKFLFEKNQTGELIEIDLSPYVNLGKATLYSITAAVIANSVDDKKTVDAAFKNAKNCGYLLTGLLGESDNTMSQDDLNKDIDSTTQSKQDYAQGFSGEEPTMDNLNTNNELRKESRLYESILLDLMEASAKKQRASQQPKKIKITKRQLNRLLEMSLKKNDNPIVAKLDKLLSSGDESDFRQGLMIASSFVQDNPDFEQMQAVRGLVKRHHNRLVNEYNTLKRDIKRMVEKRKVYRDMKRVTGHWHDQATEEMLEKAREGIWNIDRELPELLSRLDNIEGLIQIVIDDVFYE